VLVTFLSCSLTFLPCRAVTQWIAALFIAYLE
jgi:hypothetical protein